MELGLHDATNQYRRLVDCDSNTHISALIMFCCIAKITLEPAIIRYQPPTANVG